MKRATAFASAFLLAVFAAGPGAAGQITIIHLNPDKPGESWIRVAEWPSYLFMPNAPLRIAPGHSQGVRMISAMTGSSSQSFADIDCSSVSGAVFVGGNDPHRLDGDGDGVGCE